VIDFLLEFVLVSNSCNTYEIFSPKYSFKLFISSSISISDFNFSSSSDINWWYFSLNSSLVFSLSFFTSSNSFKKNFLLESVLVSNSLLRSENFSPKFDTSWSSNSLNFSGGGDSTTFETFSDKIVDFRGGS